MSAEIFKLKSLPVDDTVTRGARVGIKNARSTGTIIVSPDQLKTGETGVNTDILIQADLPYNDLKGFGSFTHNSSIVSSYTGSNNLLHGDILRKEGETVFYTVTGIEGTNVFLTSKYTGVTGGEGICTIRKVELDSVQYEYIKQEGIETVIYYNKNNLVWAVTGSAGMTGPFTAITGETAIDTGLTIAYQKSSSGTMPDLTTVATVNKTIVNNNSSEITDLGISPMPYPHESLKLSWGPVGKTPTLRKEYNPEIPTSEGEYFVNYSQNPDLLYPRPAYPDRSVAYIKFLGDIFDEPQVSISQTFGGSLALRKAVPGVSGMYHAVQNVIPNSETIKIATEPLTRNTDYVVNYNNGIIDFAKHQYREEAVDTISYTQQLMWDGISVIRGVGFEDLKNSDLRTNKNLVIAGVTGLEGITGIAYFEDVDENALVRDTDYAMEFTSGAVRFTNALKENESILVSYYVEGEDVEKEKISSTYLRIRKYPILRDTVILMKRASDASNAQNIVMTEGTDYEISYQTGWVKIKDTSLLELPSYSLDITYTPLSQINVILQKYDDDPNSYRMTVIDDYLTIAGDVVDWTYTVNNPIVSIPVSDPFKDDTDPTKVTWEGSINDSPYLYLRDDSNSRIAIDTTGYTYDDTKRQIKLKSGLNINTPAADDRIVATYRVNSYVLPYAPMQPIFPVIEAGSSQIVIEGFDRTDVLHNDMILRIDNFDPVATYYFKISDVKYENSDTTITFFTSFPEDIKIPTFRMLDDHISWRAFPGTTKVDRTASKGSSTIAFKGDGLEVLSMIKSGCLLQIDSKYIYQVLSSSLVNDITTVNIFPMLARSAPTAVMVSSLPVIDEGVSTLPLTYYIVQDPVQPAFTIQYKPYKDSNGNTLFEGSGTIVVEPTRIVLREFINGVENPSPYIFPFSTYGSLYSLAQAIQSTRSTFTYYVDLFPDLPPYNPFSMSPSEGVENYYLSSRLWPVDSIISFTEPTPQPLPYTVTISVDVYKSVLPQAQKGVKFITVKEADVSNRFALDTVNALKDRFSGDFYFHEISSIYTPWNATYTGIKDTEIEYREPLRLNMLGPDIYTPSEYTWGILPNTIVYIEYAARKITFSGVITTNLRPGTMLKFGDTYVSSVQKIERRVNEFDVTVSPILNPAVKPNVYHGYVKYTNIPLPISEQDVPQPYLSLSYSSPTGHIGYATVEVTSDMVTFREVLDNFQVADPIELTLADYSTIGELVSAVEGIDSKIPVLMPSIVSYKPFKALLTAGNDSLGCVLTQTSEQKILPYNVEIGQRAFTVNYAVPNGYTGYGDIQAYRDRLVFKETLVGYTGGIDVSKTTEINYVDSISLAYLANNAIPSVESIVSGQFPFSSGTTGMEDVIAGGTWDVTTPLPSVSITGALNFYVTIKTGGWGLLSPLGERRLTIDQDYSVEAGAIALTTPIIKLERYRVNYMGSMLFYDREGDVITCTCKNLSSLPAKSRLDLYMDFINIDQFYLQKITEQRFLEIVTSPELENLLNQKGGAGGQSADTGAGDDTVPNYLGGVVDYRYLLRDEQIKKQLYKRIYDWYKERTRAFASELQLTMGFKLGNSNAVAVKDGHYTLEDDYVEDVNYTMLTEDDFLQINRGFSRFFPVGYEESYPVYMTRFGNEYLSYNEVYCYNITYIKDETYGSAAGEVIGREGRVKSVNPYWTQNLDWSILTNVEDNLVAYYNVPVTGIECNFSAQDSRYSFLKRIAIGDSINIQGYDKFYKIANVATGVDSQSGKVYDALILDNKFTEKGIKKYKVYVRTDGYKYIKVQRRGILAAIAPDLFESKKSFTNFESALTGEGFNALIKRQSTDPFPMYDDEFNYGTHIDGGVIEGHVRNTDRIRKFSVAQLLLLMFGIPFDPSNLMPKYFRIQVGRYDEETLSFVPVETIVIDLSELYFKEERKVSSTMDAIKTNFNENPVPVADDPYGLSKYFYMEFEKVYDDTDRRGYHEGYVLRSKDRNYWYRFLLDDDNDVASEYGFEDTEVYKNFYDPNNIYRRMLLEKQAWETEELVIKDLYDYNDKLARSFQQGEVNTSRISLFKGYLASYTGSADPGISNWLSTRIPAYQSHLYFLIGGNTTQGDPGSVMEILRPDGAHDEDDATAAIAQSYVETTEALSKYQGAYNWEVYYNDLNYQNNLSWQSDYVKWVLSLEQGNMYQKDARHLYETQAGIIPIGLRELAAFSLSPKAGTPLTVTKMQYLCDHTSVALIASAYRTDNPSEVYTDVTYVISMFDSTKNRYKTLTEITSEIASKKIAGTEVFSAIMTFTYYPYGNQSCQRLLEKAQAQDINLVTGSAILITNVADHRIADPRILYMDRKLEDKLPTDNVKDKNNPYWTFPLYTSNGNSGKKAIEGLPVAGIWSEDAESMYDAISITCPDSSWRLDYKDTIETGAESSMDHKVYAGPYDILSKIDREGKITPDEYTYLKENIENNEPQVTMLKRIVLVRENADDSETSLPLYLREHRTVNDLVDYINNVRFDAEGNIGIDPAKFNRKLFSATLIGNANFQGLFKSYELRADYEPILKSFRVGPEEADPLIPDIFLYNQLVGWQLSSETKKAGESFVLSAPIQRYSIGETQDFVPDAPLQARERMRTLYPLGLKQDTLAFDIYCWDAPNAAGECYVEIVSNWMYFVSARVAHVGIPLAGSGDSSVSERETIARLVARINTHAVIGKVFYANLKYTRSDSVSPGYFEYTYLPNQIINVTQSTLNDYVLRKDTGMTLYSSSATEAASYRATSLGTAPIDTSGSLLIRSDVKAMLVNPRSGYTFSASSIAVDDALNTMDLSCTWTFDYTYSKVFAFATYPTLGALIAGINLETIPQLGFDLFDSTTAIPATASTALLAASGALTAAPVTLNITGPAAGITLRMDSMSGVGYSIISPTFIIPVVRDRIILTTIIRYSGTYTPPTYDLSPGNYTLTTLSSAIAALKPYVHPIFTPIFSASVYNSAYASTDSSNIYDLPSTPISNAYPQVRVENIYTLAGRTFQEVADTINLDTSDMGVSVVANTPYADLDARYTEPKALYTDVPATIAAAGTAVSADFRSVIGMHTLGMDKSGTFTVLENTIDVSSEEGTYTTALPGVSADLHDWIEGIRGTYKTGLTKLVIHAIPVDGVPHGILEEVTQTLTKNTPAHVFFGFMGDIKFVQISDYNLYTQLNSIQQRLGEPYDIYTNLAHDGEENEFAINKDKFLYYMRTTRYNQIKNSISKEQLPNNEYLWLYLKFHKEFGCDQRVITLTKQIASNDKDKNTIGTLG